MIIKNGFITDPATQRTGLYDIRIEDGLIKEIAPDLAPEPSEETLDACGLTVAPGLIDTHVHFRDPGFTHKETLHTGALAAAKGGFTSVICMANTSPTVDSVPVLDDILTRAKAEKIRIYQAGAVSRSLKGEELTDMDALKKAGACGFTDDGIPLRNASFLYNAMEKAKSYGIKRGVIYNDSKHHDIAMYDLNRQILEEDSSVIRIDSANMSEAVLRLVTKTNQRFLF